MRQPAPICAIFYKKGAHTAENISVIRKMLNDKMKDYHILLFPSETINDLFDIKVFASKDATPITIAELKSMVEKLK